MGFAAIDSPANCFVLCRDQHGPKLSSGARDFRANSQ